MALKLWPRTTTDSPVRDWDQVKAFYAECRDVALVRHGAVLNGTTHHDLFPAVHETEWMAVTQFELMESVRLDSAADTLDTLDQARKDTLWFITLAALGSDAAFAAMVAKDRLGLAGYMQVLRQSWAKARQAPPSRARIGESKQAVLVRLNKARSVMQAYEAGRDALLSGQFADNTAQQFLLPYAVVRHSALVRQVSCRWVTAPRFTALTAIEQQALTRLYEVLMVGDDVHDLMDEVCSAPPNGDMLALRIKLFQSSASDLALENDVTPDLPRGAPNMLTDLAQNPFDAALCLYQSALTFEATRDIR